MNSSLVFILPILVGLTTQFTKYIVHSLQYGWGTGSIFAHGHMPSAHAAFVISLLTSVGHYEGIKSGAFAVAFILAIIVIDDALRLRMHMSAQSRYANALVKKLDLDPKEFPTLNERVGHKPEEVVVGSIFGFFLTLALIFFFA